MTVRRRRPVAGVQAGSRAQWERSYLSVITRHALWQHRCGEGLDTRQYRKARTWEDTVLIGNTLSHTDVQVVEWVAWGKRELRPNTGNAVTAVTGNGGVWEYGMGA